MLLKVLFVALFGYVASQGVADPRCPVPDPVPALRLPHDTDCTRHWLCQGGLRHLMPPCPNGWQFDSVTLSCRSEGTCGPLPPTTVPPTTVPPTTAPPTEPPTDAPTDPPTIPPPGPSTAPPVIPTVPDQPPTAPTVNPEQPPAEEPPAEEPPAEEPPAEEPPAEEPPAEEPPAEEPPARRRMW